MPKMLLGESSTSFHRDTRSSFSLPYNAERQESSASSLAAGNDLPSDSMAFNAFCMEGALLSELLRSHPAPECHRTHCQSRQHLQFQENLTGNGAQCKILRTPTGEICRNLQHQICSARQCHFGSCKLIYNRRFPLCRKFPLITTTTNPAPVFLFACSK